MQDRKSISSFFVFVSYFLIIIPFVLIFNDLLTRILNNFELYIYLQKFVAPFEIRIIGYIVRIFGINYIPLNNAMIVNTREISMNWNCLGWQSFVLFICSLFIGFRGQYTVVSKLITIFLGLFGIFWVNILRISLLVLLYAYSEPIYTIIYHDYFSAIVSILYLFVYWWFSYTYILEDYGKHTEGD